MNRINRALWNRRLTYRKARLKVAIKDKDQQRVKKWRLLIQQAQYKLGIKKPVVKQPVKVTPPKAKVPTKGIDVYEGDGSIEWAKVKKAGYEYVFCKTSEGGDWSDPSWTTARVDAIRAADVKLGVYHFLRPKAGRSGAEEGRFFIKQAKSAGWGKVGDIRPVIDFENTALSPAKTAKYVAQAIAEIKRLTGKTPIIYTGGPFWDENTNSLADNYGCPLWLAAYVKNPEQYLPAAWKKAGWTIWQHTDQGSVPGVTASNVDQNIAKDVPTL